MTTNAHQLAARRRGLDLRLFATNHRIELLVAAAVFLLNVSTPPNPIKSQIGYEQWINLTNQMFYGHQDFLFSYGPLYWLTGGATQPFSVWTYWASVVVPSILGACFWSLIVSLCHKARSLPLLGLAFFLFFSGVGFPPLQFLWPFVVVTYLEYHSDTPIRLRPIALLALGVLVGASFYVRYFYGVIALATFAPYFLSRIVITRSPRELLLVLAGTIMGYGGCGLMIFHSERSIINYIAINNQLSFGNSVDMTLDVANTPITYLVIAMISALLAAYMFLSRKVLILTLTALLLLLFKLGFSRTDHYLAYSVLPVSALSLFLIFSTLRTSRIAFCIIMGLLFYLGRTPSYPGAPTHNALASPYRLADSYPQRMQALFSDFRLPNDARAIIGNSTIDVYPFRNEYLFANRLNYLHRPLFQNYMTLTPALDARNERFFEGKDRPRFVLWTGEIPCAQTCDAYVDVDGRLALNEDPLTTSAILLNYHVALRSRAPNGAAFLLLEENQASTPYTQAAIVQTDMTFNQWFPVPGHANGVVKLVPHFAFTTVGRLKNLLFRGRPLFINYRLVSGDVRRFRLNILNTESGIWVSPLPSDLTLVGSTVAAVMIENPFVDYIDSTFRAQWISVPLANVRTRQIDYAPILPSEPAADSRADGVCNGNIDSLNGASSPSKVDVTQGWLSVHGWLAYSTSQDILPDHTFLTLTGPNGKRMYIAARQENRPDIGAYFNHSDLSAGGYQAIIDLSGIEGAYTLGMAGLHGSQLFTCNQFAIPIDIGH